MTAPTPPTPRHLLRSYPQLFAALTLGIVAATLIALARPEYLFICPLCGKGSTHPQDAANRFRGACRVFLPTTPGLP